MGKNEDYNLGGSISNNSEKLIHRGRGEVSVIHYLSGERYGAVEHMFWQKLAATRKEPMSLLMILVTF